MSKKHEILAGFDFPNLPYLQDGEVCNIVLSNMNYNYKLVWVGKVGNLEKLNLESCWGRCGVVWVEWGWMGGHDYR